MSPEQRSTVAELSRLRVEILADRAALTRALGDCQTVANRWQAGPPDRPYLAMGAVGLHAWYTGLESLLERIAKLVDGSVPTGEAWHRDLVSQAMTELPGIRPAVLPRTLQADVLALLGFRHFFRHAYSVEIEPAKLQVHLVRVGRIAPAVETALAEFDVFLADAIAGMAKS